MTISSGIGLISGIDYAQLISDLLELERTPINNLELQQTYYQTQISLFQSINRNLVELQDALSDLTDTSIFSEKIASSSDNTIATVEVSGTASAGTYSLKVLQLAQAHRLAAAGFVDSDETGVAGSSGVFKFKVGDGDEVTINVDEDMTLEDLRDSINNADGGLRASIINDGTPTNPYRLILTSESVGTDNQIVITQNDTNLDFSNNIIEDAYAYESNTFNGTVTSSGTYTGSGTENIVVKIVEGGAIGVAKFKVSTDGGVTFDDTVYTTDTSPVQISDSGVEISFSVGTQDFAVNDMFSIDAFNPVLQEAKNAIIELDGIKIIRDSNTISDVIDGLTINLESASSTETVTIKVREDNSSISTKINAFISAWEDVNSLINTQLSLTDDDEAMPLFGDFTLRSIKSQLASMVTGFVQGASDNFNSLASIGITVDRDGNLELDSTVLTEALENNLMDVKLLFQRFGKAVSNNNLTYISATANTKPGTYAVYVTAAATQASTQGNQAIDPAGITNDEILTFTVDGSEYTVNLTAGDTTDVVVDKINTVMESSNLDVIAENDGGILNLRTEAYGTSATFKVVSDQDGSTSEQTGIGTTEIEAKGTNIQGTIGGKPATGNGLILTGLAGYDTEGLSVRIENNATGFIDNINFSQGIFNRLESLVDTFSDSINGTITERVTGLENQIDDIDDSIARLETLIAKREESLTAQFVALEQMLATLQSQADYVVNILGNLYT